MRLTDRAEVLAWLESSKRGHKAASKKFGIPRETIRGWARSAPEDPPAPNQIDRGMLGRLEQVALAGLAKKSAAGDTAAARALLTQVETLRARSDPERQPGAHASALEMFASAMSSTQIAAQIGVSPRTVKRWRAKWKADGGQPQRDVNREPPAKQARAPSGPSGDQDPVEYWRSQEINASQASLDAIELKHSNAAAVWTRIAHDCRKHLDSAKKEHAAAEARKARSLQRDPEAIARRVLRALPFLLRTVPDMAAEVRAQIDSIVPRDPEAAEE